MLGSTGLTIKAGDTDVMKIILYILGFFALIGFLMVAGCFKLVF